MAEEAAIQKQADIVKAKIADANAEIEKLHKLDGTVRVGVQVSRIPLDPKQPKKGLKTCLVPVISLPGKQL